MSKPIGMTLAAAGIACLALTGCSHSGKVRSALASESANPAVVQAQAEIKACVAKTGFITKADREALMSCIAPAGTKAQVETCVQAAVSTDGLLLTKADRAKFEQTDAPDCVVAAASPAPSPAGSSNGTASTPAPAASNG